MTEHLKYLTRRLHRWTLRVRVFAKSDIVNWDNGRSTGTLFSFDACDRSGELRLIAFGDECLRFFPAVRVGRIYIVTGGTIQIKNEKFNHLEGHFEIRLDKRARIVEDNEGGQDHQVPRVYGHFINVRELLETMTSPSNSCPGISQVGEFFNNLFKSLLMIGNCDLYLRTTLCPRKLRYGRRRRPKRPP